jgi:hypothetical protein
VRDSDDMRKVEELAHRIWEVSQRAAEDSRRMAELARQNAEKVRLIAESARSAAEAARRELLELFDAIREQREIFAEMAASAHDLERTRHSNR